MNGELKSQLDWIQHLYNCVLPDVYDLAGVSPIEARRDIATINQRLSCEGLSFVTKTLPLFGKTILTAFQTGVYRAPTGFKKKSESSALPALLCGLTSKVFDLKDGSLRADADSTSVWGLQQICFLLYKYQVPYTDDQIRSAFKNVEQVNASLPKTSHDVDLTMMDRTVLALARDIVSEMVSDVDLKQIAPKMGPGSTSKGPLSMPEKYAEMQTSGLPSGYGNSYAYTYYTCDGEIFHMDHSTRLRPCYERVERDRVSIFHFVPKDSRGPRGISAEPVGNMWIQQGQRRALERAASSYSKRRINFKDQTVNGNLALRASRTGRYATLDMKDASDRVSKWLVSELFPEHVLLPLLASRSVESEYREYPEIVDGKRTTVTRKIKLNKFAPMGSAVCFVIEAIVFYSLAVAAVLANEACSEGTDPRRHIYVFGDDIICPTEWVDVIINSLERFYLKFNRDKCYSKGPFRESCGVDAFNGDIVTPIRIKTPKPVSLRHVDAVIAWRDYMNEFSRQWMWRTSNLLQTWLEEIIHGQLPVARFVPGALYAMTFSAKAYEAISKPLSIDPQAELADRWEQVSRVDDPKRKVALGRKLRPWTGGFTLNCWTICLRKKVDRSQRNNRYYLLDWLSQRNDLRPYEVNRSISERTVLQKSNVVMYEYHDVLKVSIVDLKHVTGVDDTGRWRD